MARRRALFGFIFAIIFFCIPIQVSAVDYTITDFFIEAQMLENGDVHVQELFTYSLSGKFNGITREIIPKEGSKITGFEAFEHGVDLTVEKKDDTYKIYRGGKDERIQIKLHYTIKDGISKYADLVEFHWPFFDRRNESTYGKVNIAIHPPSPTDDVIGFGYDSAFNTEKITSEGVVYFDLGKVKHGENGDIRVAYDASLFPKVAQFSNEHIRERLIEEQQLLINREKQYRESKEKVMAIGSISLPVLFIFVTVFVIFAFLRTRRMNHDVWDEIYKRDFIIPQQKISMSATIYHQKGFSAEGMAAALFDLVRKGYVTQKSADQFVLVNAQTEFTHEQILIGWLFYEVGKDGTFRSGDLEKYVNDEENHPNYSDVLRRWREAVKEEVKDYGVRESGRVSNLFFGLISIALIPLTVLFIIYELYLLMFIAIILFGLTLIILLYTPLSNRGLMLQKEWQHLWEQLSHGREQDWRNWSKDERLRVIIYGIGTKRNKDELSKYFEKLERRQMAISDQGAFSSYWFTWPSFSSSFVRADDSYSKSQSSSSSSSFSGGGTGGGGGGSGAF